LAVVAAAPIEVAVLGALSAVHCCLLAGGPMPLLVCWCCGVHARRVCWCCGVASAAARLPCLLLVAVVETWDCVASAPQLLFLSCMICRDCPFCGQRMYMMVRGQALVVAQ
jgi:hypothetical protein